ncbi:MAG: hypothetical protein EP338_07405 [Bacteroidetes bacterium]|nr:MAG: hypothetical protein EP338_07405 [Bacteroidota bacterium]
MKRHFLYPVIGGLVLLVSSCAGISHVTDDDVYVVKSPVLPLTDEVNDESSYENYRYRRDREDFDVYYGHSRMLWRPYLYWSSPYSSFGLYGYNYNPYMYGHPYSPYAWNDPFSPYYNPGSWYYSPYSGFGYNPYYNPYYGYYGGYGYGSWANNGNNSGSGNNSNSLNKHYKPRNSVSGNYIGRRPNSPGMAGMIVQGNSQGRRASITQDDHLSNAHLKGGRPVHSASSTDKTYRSRPVQHGTAISKPGRTISTNNARSTGSSRPSGSSMERSGGSQMNRSGSGNSGGMRPSSSGGGSRPTSSPRPSSGGGSKGRRGG